MSIHNSSQLQITDNGFHGDRQLMGDDLSGLNVNELSNLEHQLESSLHIIRMKKVN